MKKILVLFFIVATLGVFVSCSSDSSSGPEADPYINISSPEQGSIWYYNELKNITWDDNIYEDVKIELFNGGTLKLVLAENTESDGSFEWLIPQNLPYSSNYSIKITSIINSAATITSPTFTIAEPPYINITTPSATTIFDAGEQESINWEDNIPEEVKIELFKAGEFNQVITDSTISDGNYEWLVPDSLSYGQDYQIKITSRADENVSDFSNNFQVKGDISITSPSSGDVWYCAAQQTIIWNDNIDDNVKIELYRGSNLEFLIAENTESDGSFEWTVSDELTPADNYFIKITNVANSSISKYSSQFSIATAPSINVTSPTSGSLLQTGETELIRWEDNINDFIKIELYKAGEFNQVINDSTESDGYYEWLVPEDLTLGQDYQIKISSTLNNNISNFSSNFEIAGNISITSPTSGYVWYNSTPQTITWNDNISENVKIELYKNNSFECLIVESTPSTGNYEWLVLDNLDSSDNYQVKITSIVNSEITNLSDLFSIALAPSINITSPSSGSLYQTGEVEDLNWQDNINEEVKIELLKGGVLNQVIIESTTSNGSYEWSVPEDLSLGQDYQIKITSVTNSNLNDTSDNFEITGNINITSPIEGTVWYCNDTETITWEDNLPEEVKIELYKNNSIEVVITENTPSNGSFVWTIPSNLEISSNYQIKIISSINSSVTVFSTPFTIEEARYITVTSPTSTSLFQTGETETITWDDNISENVKIELYKAGSLNQAIVASTASDGSYEWAIPENLTLGQDYQIKITGTVTTDLNSISENFEIAGNISISSPTSQTVCYCNEPIHISWEDNLTEDKKIELYRGNSFNQVIVETISNTGNYEWIIPENLNSGSNYKIKISSNTNSQIYNFSPEFTIEEARYITVTSPTSTSLFQTGETETITWDDNLTENVKIELYKAGSLNQVIVASTTSDGSYEWAIPENFTLGEDYQFKITGIDNTHISDISENFEIAGNISVLTPVINTVWYTATTKTITWDDNISENVKIELYRANTLEEVITESTESDGSYEWTIPEDLTSSSFYTIKIMSTENSNITSLSPVFSIFEYPVMTSPNVGSSFDIGETLNLEWTSNITNEVKIELYKDNNFYNEIVSSYVTQGNYEWEITSDIEHGQDYQIKITYLDDPSVVIFSEIFTIVNLDFLWAVGDDGLGSGYGIDIDNLGNTYAIGFFRTPITFGSYTLDPQGSNDFYVAKFDTAGECLWALQGNGGAYTAINDIRTDDYGYIYISGRLYGSITIAGQTLTSQGSGDIFVAKLDSNGNFLWGTSAGSAEFDNAYSITIDNSGNSYITGFFKETVNFGQITLSANSDKDYFIAKLDEFGNFDWVKQYSNIKEDNFNINNSNSVTYSELEYLYITGSFQDTVNFGSTILTSNGESDIFILKMDTDGNIIWAKQIGSSGSDVGNSITINSSDNIYLTGSFNGVVNFGSSTLNSSNGSMYVSKLNSDGNLVWTNQYDYKPVSIATDIYGNSYITGRKGIDFDHDPLFIKILDNNGIEIYSQLIGSFGGSSVADDIGYDIVADNNRNCYVTGSFKEEITFGSFTLPGFTNSPFIIKLGPVENK